MNSCILHNTVMDGFVVIMTWRVGGIPSISDTAGGRFSSGGTVSCKIQYSEVVVFPSFCSLTFIFRIFLLK